ncbi:MAG TPA: hypothetical protein VFV31_09315 [Chitinophagaceae bacterium]|nr:hypothetical protein [Chitinophagaceae bacterium]
MKGQLLTTIRRRNSNPVPPFAGMVKHGSTPVTTNGNKNQTKKDEH